MSLYCDTDYVNRMEDPLHGGREARAISLPWKGLQGSTAMSTP